MADPWFVEIVLDTGQRYQSVDLEGPERAASVADDMRGRVRVVAVTMVQARTGECITKPSLNLAAGVSWIEMNYLHERRLLVEAFGA